MLVNVWSGIELYCMSDRHEEAVPLKIMEADMPFYACPRYMLKDEKHPDGHPEGEKMCKNIFSLKEAEDAVMKLLSEIEKNMESGIIGDYTGYKVTAGGITVKVLEYKSLSKMKVGLLNKRTLND